MTSTSTQYQRWITNSQIDWLNISMRLSRTQLSSKSRDFISTKIFENFSRFSSWGYRDNASGMWSGMIGELVTQQADLGASPLFLTSDRIDVIDYLVCTSQTRSKFVFRSPKLSFTDNVFVLPFDRYVWSSLIALVFIAAGILFAASVVEWKAKIQEFDENSNLRPSLSESWNLNVKKTLKKLLARGIIYYSLLRFNTTRFFTKSKCSRFSSHHGDFLCGFYVSLCKLQCKYCRFTPVTFK